jgi:SPP1 family predicted phage head-tail adaptor
MRAGALDRSIAVQAATTIVDTAGTPSETWQTVATVRAQLIEPTTTEYLRGYGEGGNFGTILRIRWLDGITTDHRVQYAGRNLNIRDIKELGRRRGLELRCEEVRGDGATGGLDPANVAMVVDRPGLMITVSRWTE